MTSVSAFSTLIRVDTNYFSSRRRKSHVFKTYRNKCTKNGRDLDRNVRNLLLLLLLWYRGGTRRRLEILNFYRIVIVMLLKANCMKFRRRCHYSHRAEPQLSQKDIFTFCGLHYYTLRTCALHYGESLEKNV